MARIRTTACRCILPIPRWRATRSTLATKAPLRACPGARASSPSRLSRRTAALSALQDSKRRSCPGMDAKIDAESCPTGLLLRSLGLLLQMPKFWENHKGTHKVGCFSAWAVILSSDLVQKQLVARTRDHFS